MYLEWLEQVAVVQATFATAALEVHFPFLEIKEVVLRDNDPKYVNCSNLQGFHQFPLLDINHIWETMR